MFSGGAEEGRPLPGRSGEIPGVRGGLARGGRGAAEQGETQVVGKRGSSGPCKGWEGEGEGEGSAEQGETQWVGTRLEISRGGTRVTGRSSAASEAFAFSEGPGMGLKPGWGHWGWGTGA